MYPKDIRVVKLLPGNNIPFVLHYITLHYITLHYITLQSNKQMKRKKHTFLVAKSKRKRHNSYYEKIC